MPRTLLLPVWTPSCHQPSYSHPAKESPPHSDFSSSRRSTAGGPAFIDSTAAYGSHSPHFLLLLDVTDRPWLFSKGR